MAPNVIGCFDFSSVASCTYQLKNKMVVRVELTSRDSFALWTQQSPGMLF